MAWRASPAEARHRDGASRRAQIQSRVDRGVPIGLIGYMNDRPVAWCSIAPRETYRPLGGVLADPTERVWSLACFYIKREHRRKGLTAEVIEAAISHAQAGGATAIEAYPVERDSPSYRFMGFVDQFTPFGFHEVARAGERRHVMRLRL
jgi:RimJ/RimL family protein N-acetyltransferase